MPPNAERRPAAKPDGEPLSDHQADGIDSDDTAADQLQEARDLDRRIDQALGDTSRRQATRRSTSPEVRVAVRSAGQVRVQAGRTRIDLAPIDALELAGRLEQAAIHAERLPAPTTAPTHRRTA